MIRRWNLTLIAAGVLLAGISVAQDPPADPDPPVRLKKKTKPAEEGKVEPMKPPAEEKKPGDPPKDDGKQPEPPPAEDEQEVLQRVAKAMRAVEEKLANRELGDGTRQMQEDILKDLDALIRLTENPPQGAGGGGADNKNDQQNPSGDSQSQQGGARGQSGMKSGQQGGSQGQSGMKSGKQGGGSSGQSSGRAARAERRKQQGGSQITKGNGKQPGDPMNQGNSGSQQASKGGKDGTGGNGSGADKPPDAIANRNADLYKDVWGHLPESLRAEMQAYSSDKQFMSKYDDLVKKYYRTIAEQGRRKGD